MRDGSRHGALVSRTQDPPPSADWATLPAASTGLQSELLTAAATATSEPSDAAFATLAAAWARRQRRARALGGADAACAHWCEPARHCLGEEAAEATQLV